MQFFYLSLAYVKSETVRKDAFVLEYMRRHLEWVICGHASAMHKIENLPCRHAKKKKSNRSRPNPWLLVNWTS